MTATEHKRGARRRRAVPVSNGDVTACPILAHGHRWVGDELEAVLERLQPGGTLHDALLAGRATLRHGDTALVIAHGDQLPPRCDQRPTVLDSLAILDFIDISPGNALAVHAVLADLLPKCDGSIRHEVIARRVGLSPSTVGKALSALRMVGAVDWVHQVIDDRQVENRYELGQVTP